MRTLPNAMVSTLKFVSLFLHAELTVMHHCVRPFTGTYVTAQPGAERPEGCNPFHPISTATMDTTVFDVVHMFSERGISAVPIVDDEGIVVNLYETVDVIVSHA